MIPVRNIYHMLSYAFQSLRGGAFASCAEEEFENTADLLAEILVLGMNDQLRRGLHRTYNPLTENLASVRGRVDVTRSITECMNSRRLVCEHDEFTEDSYCNRIVKTALTCLGRCDIAPSRRDGVRSLLLILGNVKTLDPSRIDWNIRLNRNNASYVTLISVCRFALEGLILTTDDGDRKVRNYLDDQRMSRLYERFILGYYRKEHPELMASASQIEWDLRSESDEFLPVMQSDIMLSSGDRTLIIDAKYYGQNMQEHHDVRTFHSGNMYQIYAYVKNRASKGGAVSGMLLYAQTDSEVQPHGDYNIGGNMIRVRTLDLNQEFRQIAEQLDGISELLPWDGGPDVRHPRH